MRVAMVGPYPLPGRPPTGGIEAVATALVDGLVDAGADVTVVSCSTAVTTEDRVRDDGLEIRLIPYGNRMRRGVAYVSEHRGVVRALRDIAPDVVHVQGQNHIGPAALAAGLPTVVTLHGILYREQHIVDPTASRASQIRGRLRNGLNARFERYTLAHARHLVIISPYVLEAVEHLTTARIHMIPNPIEDGFFTLPRDPVPGRVLFVGVVGPRKNVLALARAFEEVRRRRPDATLHLVGRPADDRYVAALDEEITRRGLGDAVRRLGVVSDEELRREYEQATILALPSKEESSPMAIQQAMAMGLPVVASRAGGIPFLVDDGETGLLATPDDDGDLADRLSTALDDHALRARMAATCRERAERFRASSVCAATLEAYRMVAPQADPATLARAGS